MDKDILEAMHPLDRQEYEAKASQEEFLRQVSVDQSLVFNVFSTPAGKKLLERWTAVLINQPTVAPNLDLISIGMNEGYKSFIRTILNSVNQQKDQS